MTLHDMIYGSKKKLQIGRLGKEATEIICPACRAIGISDLRKEVVTCTQRCFWNINKLCFCGKIPSIEQFDFNHYCKQCGCYIGRYIKISWYKKQTFKCKRFENADTWEFKSGGDESTIRIDDRENDGDQTTKELVDPTVRTIKNDNS